MIIGGLEKLTLIDYPGKVACTVFTLGCNFGCGFCHNPELVMRQPGNAPVLSEKDFFDFLTAQKKYLDGVCITGGEPTLQKDLIDFIKNIKSLGFAVKLDTNGSHPEVLEKLISNGLVDYIAMDIKGPLDNYSKIVGCEIDKEKIKRSVELIRSSGVDYEFRTTVLPELHSPGDLKKVGEWLTGSKKYYLQQFRKGKTLNPDFSDKRGYNDEELKKICESLKPYFETCEVRLN